MDDEKDCTLYLGSLSDKITENLLVELFSQAGPVDHVSLKKGFGFVTFAHHISIPYSLKLFEGLKLYGRPIVMKPRDGSMYANQGNQRRQGNQAGIRNHSTPSPSFNPRLQMDSRNITPLTGGGSATPVSQQWGLSHTPVAGFQLQRPMVQPGNSDHRNDRNLPFAGFREQSRTSFDGGKFSGFRGGRDEANGASSTSKSFRANTQAHWGDPSTSKNFSGPHSNQGSSFGRRDSQGDRGRYTDRQSSGDFRSHDWNRGQRASFGGGNDSRNRRDNHFQQRNERHGGGHRPHHGDKPYSRQQPANRFSQNDFNRFGNAGRRS